MYIDKRTISKFPCHEFTENVIQFLFSTKIMKFIIYVHEIRYDYIFYYSFYIEQINQRVLIKKILHINVLFRLFP